MTRKKNKNNNFQIIYGYFLLYILVKFKYRYQTVGQTVEVLMRLNYDGRKVRYPRANRKTMRSKRLHANRKQSYVLQCEGIHAYT